MNQLQNILLIEDKAKNIEPFIKAGEKSGVNIKVCETIEDVEEAVLNLSCYQMVILDWIFEGDSSDSAKVCLKKIRNCHFIPVVIWTEEKATFENEAEEVYKMFPQAFLKVYEKLEYKILSKELNRWFSQPPMNFTEQFRTSVRKAVELALYNLAENTQNDLSNGLKSLIQTGQNSSTLDIEHAITVLMRFVRRNVYKDEGFITELNHIITDIQEDESEESKSISPNIEDFYMFYEPNDRIIRTGDIVNVEINQKKFRGVVLTPACDLAIIRRAKYLRIGIIREAKNSNERKNNNFSDKWGFFEDKKKKFVLHHQTITLKDISLISNENLNSVMTYDHTFQTMDEHDICITREKRLDDPYRADLLHHFASHAGRIGTPVFKTSK